MEVSTAVQASPVPNLRMGEVLSGTRSVGVSPMRRLNKNLLMGLLDPCHELEEMRWACSLK